MRGALWWLAMRERLRDEGGSCRCTRGTGQRDQDRGRVTSTHLSNAAASPPRASSTSRPTNRCPAYDLASSAERRPYDRATVAAELKLETAARQFRRRRVGEDLTPDRVARESGGAVDDLAGGPRSVNARSSRRDPDRCVDLRDPEAEIEGAQGFVAQRLADAEVEHDGVAAEFRRVRATRP